MVQAAEARVRAAEEAAGQRTKEANRAHRRVAEVENEMRTLLAALDRQKRASAAKVAELAAVVHELQTPMLTWQSPALA